MNKCLICTKPVSGNVPYHSKCVNTLFDSGQIPSLDYRLGDLAALAKKSVRQRITVPGIQTKLSLEIQRKAGEADKLTIVGLWGRYILKPPSNRWPELPENEHCTMMMADAAGIETVPYGLIHLASGERSYITRRIDRSDDGHKYAMEDMCQLTGRLSEDKYKGSHEQIAAVIKQYSANPLFDLTRFFELVFFSWLTGNADMHLKNFSLFKDPELGWKLAPAYDLLSTRLVIPAEKDPDELSLTIQGKRSNFSLDTFKSFGKHIGLNKKQVANILGRLAARQEAFAEIVEASFLSEEMKEVYHRILDERYKLFE